MGPNDPAGLGWTMHFGRLTNLNSITPGPIIEMPDGSSHPTFRHMNTAPGDAYMTRDLWSFEKTGEACDAPATGMCPLLRLPNGIRYIFSHGNFTSGVLYATSIRDPFGNKILIAYQASPDPAYVTTVTQVFNTGETRQVSFTYENTPLPGGSSVKRLSRINFGNRQWQYTYQATGTGFTRLASVQPPVGPPWSFEYYTNTEWPKPYLLKKVTTPHGGHVTYNYQAQQFFYGSTVVYSPALSSRVTGGTDVAAGTSTYAFSQQPPYWNQPVVATVNEPCRTTTYETWAIGPAAGNEQPWRIGAIKKKTTSGGGATQVEDYEWIASVPISPDPESGSSSDTHAPLLRQRTINRDGRSYTTTHTYHASAWGRFNPRSFNDYGNPERTDEAGHVTRMTEREFFHPLNQEFSLANYIGGKVSVEDVTVGSETFTRRWTHVTPTGFLGEENLYGIVTTFAPDAGGNVRFRTDGENNRTEFVWDWGVPETIKSAVGFWITRSVANDSTIQWERRRNFTTNFAYDALFRQTVLDPPEGDSTTWTYDNTNGRTVTVTRGASSTTSTLDGFGRVSATNNSVSVLTNTNYDACGRVSYRSYPYTGGADIGESFQYDGLDRLDLKTNPGGSNVDYSYAAGSDGIRVTIRDEENRTTDQYWEAFGTPEDARLAKVLDAGSGAGDARSTTTYLYNALGSLTRVTPQSGPVRTWTYNSNGLLGQETNPENGTIVYGYHDNGLLETRDDAQFAQSVYTYDRNNRLTRINRPSNQPDIEFRYDDSDNRTFLLNGNVRSELGPYDGNNRLRKRIDTLEARSFTTLYEYDTRDNLREITYPSQAKVLYTHDSQNRILTVKNGGGVPYADGFLYHPSGGVSQYRSGNNVTNTVAYHANRYWITNTTSAGLLGLGYGHDNVGNVTSTTQAVPVGNYSYTYDKVDRLKIGDTTSTGAWGDVSFTYDERGNRLTKSIGGQATTFDYVNNLLVREMPSGAPAIDFVYDSNGNTTSDGPGRIHTYNADNMLVRSQVGPADTTYAYDGDLLRKLKKSGSASTYYVHGLGGQLLGEMQRTSTAALPVRDYIYAGTRLVASIRPPTLVVSPETLSFAYAISEGIQPPPRPIQITEAAGANVSWTATDNATWLSVTPAAGSTPATASVSVNPAGLQVGNHHAVITIQAPGTTNLQETVVVWLTVTQDAALVVNPPSLAFRAIEGDTSAGPQSLTILYSGNASPSWSATGSASWIAVSPGSGQTPADVEVTLSPPNGTEMVEGTYRGWITVSTTPPVNGSPQIIPIELVVEPSLLKPCANDAWYCELFDDLMQGDINGQAGWESYDPNSGQVYPDPRGAGNVLLLDPPPGEYIHDIVKIRDRHLIDGNQVSVQVMTSGVPENAKQVGKLELFTTEGYAWGKTHRTFAALRFGSTMYLQYGANIWQVIIDRMDPGRWYAVKLVFQGNIIEAWVDGELVFETVNPLSSGLPYEAFSTTGWGDFPGEAYLDRLEARPLPTGLVVVPKSLAFRAVEGQIGGRATGQGTAALVRTTEAGPAPAAQSSPRSSPKRFERPMVFEPNVGQFSAPVRLAGRTGGARVAFSPGEVELSRGQPDGGLLDDRVRLRFVGGGGRQLEGTDLMTSTTSIFKGSDPLGWRTGIPNYGKVRYREAFPGVDAIFYGNGGQLEFDLVLTPGAKVDDVALAYDGVHSVALDGDGALLLDTGRGILRQMKPVIYQDKAGVRSVVDGGYVIRAGNEVGFQIASYDPAEPLVIDPVLSFSTYYGGLQGAEWATAVAVDDEGYVFMAGYTGSDDLPVPGGLFPTQNGIHDLFVSKWSSQGNLIWGTYLGSPGSEDANAITVDRQGNVYVVGSVGWFDFPVTPDAVQPNYALMRDAFLTKINPAGNALMYSTYLGGGGQEQAFSVVVTDAGTIYISGDTGSNTIAGATPTRVNPNGGGPAGGDSFVARFNGAGTAIQDLVYLNGTGQESSGKIAVDGGGNVFVFGYTTSPPMDGVQNPFPATPGAFQTAIAPGYEWDLYVTKLDSQFDVVYSSYLGGGSQEIVGGVAVEPGCVSNCSAYLVGATSATNFPVVLPAIWPQFGGPRNWAGFLTKFSPGGNSLVYSTYLGAVDDDWMTAIVVDADGKAYISGRSTPASIPAAKCTVRDVFTTGYWDALLLKVDAAATALEYCAIIGAPGGNDVARAVALAPTGDILLAGTAAGVGFHTTPGAYQSYDTSGAFLAMFAENDTGPRISLSSNSYTVTEDEGHLVVTVLRGGDITTPVSVNYETFDGTATAPADYTHTEDVLEFDPFETALAFTVPVVQDMAAEPDETFGVKLHTVVGGRLGYPVSATVSLLDDDGLTRTFLIKDRVLPVGPNWTTSVWTSPPGGWLSLATPGPQIGPSTVIATVDPTGLVPGVYTGIITVEGDTGDSPQFVDVKLTVTPQ